ncbi:MAG: hypothetical protein IT379_37335 [Deltaproteobacteria bacterium]|nr:hypothetical protein [Deltaproteobacteria bacterium]
MSALTDQERRELQGLREWRAGAIEGIGRLERQVRALEHRKRDLRDQFAMAALTGILSATTKRAQDQQWVYVDPDAAANEAYQFADEMLARREVKP